MKSAAISDFKVHLSKYLRMVKGGEVIELKEHGVPIATVNSVKNNLAFESFIPPRADPARLGTMKFSLSLSTPDPLVFLLEDRAKR